MSIWGKIIGGAAGFALGGPLGALLGGAAGHVVDRTVSERPSDVAGEAAAPTKQIAFTIAVIALGAKLAKADGTVTRAEVEAFRQVFHVAPDEVRNVARFFDQARKHAHGYEPYARQISGMFADQPAVLEELLGCLFHIAKADGHVSQEEDDYVRHVAQMFGFSIDDYERIRADHLGPTAGDPYQVIGVPHDAGDDAVKTAYRKLVHENHPDKLIAAGMPEEFIDVANEKLANINAAYDEIQKRRGLS